MKLHITKRVIIFLGLIIFSGNILAQTQPRVEPSELGSTAKVVGVFNQNLAEAIRLALPGYDDQALGALFESVAKKYANGFDPLQINLDAIEALFQIKAFGDGEAQERDYGYQISKKAGRIYLHKDRSSIKPYSVRRGNAELKLVSQTHPAMLRLFGINQSQLSSFHSNLILFEGVQKLPTGGYGKPTSPVVDNIYSYGQRSVEGILTEGSYIKILSKNALTNEGLIINWPRFQLHPELQRFEVRSKADLLNEAAEHIKRVANPKHEVNVKMAVVFRPVMVGETKVFIPAMKIGLYSRPFADAFANEKGENGELFYVDLMKQSLKYTDREDQDGGSGGEKII